MSETQKHPFDVATDGVEEVNEMLAETDCAIAEMAFDGAIGYHEYVAKGESHPEYLWKTALLQALDETVFEMMYVDNEDPRDARMQVEHELGEYFDSFTAEFVADQFEDNLNSLIDAQESRAADEEVPDS